MDLLLLIRQQPRNSKSAAAMSTALLRRLAITGPTAAARQTFSARHRNDGKIYWPGSGIRSEKELAEEVCANTGRLGMPSCENVDRRKIFGTIYHETKDHIGQ
jgi:hypothetical protein